MRSLPVSLSRPSKLSGVDHGPGALPGPGHGCRIEQLAVRLDDHLQRQSILAGEFEVALVMGRHRHDRPGAIVHQDEIGEVDRHLPPGQRIDTVAAGEDPFLFDIVTGALHPVKRLGVADEQPRPRPCAPAVVRTSARGCSGARLMKVAPQSVSGRVVKTRDLLRGTGHGKIDFASHGCDRSSCVAWSVPIPAIRGADRSRPAVRRHRR